MSDLKQFINEEVLKYLRVHRGIMGIMRIRKGGRIIRRGARQISRGTGSLKIRYAPQIKRVRRKATSILRKLKKIRRRKWKM